MPLHLRPKGYFGTGSVEVEPPARAGESGVRRLTVRKEALVTQPVLGIDTVSDVIDYAARVHGNRRAMGWRDVIDVHEEKKEVKKWIDGKETTETKTWKYFQLSDYKYIDYLQLKEAISEVARAFLDLGIGKESVVDMFAETSLNWQIISHACALISSTTATAYETLGELGLTHSLREPSCVAVFTNPSLLPLLLKVLPNTPSVNFVFYDGSPSSSLLEQIKSLRSENPIRVIHIDDLRALGRSKDLSTLEPHRPNRDTTACIMYTSGSTGAPKGVCLTHGNLIASLGAVYAVFGPHLPAGGRYIAYLPLTHVLEYVVELCAVFVGVTCGYARPKTLTDASVRECQGDLSALKPNVMFGVPAVYEMIRKAVMGKVNSSGYLTKTVFHAALGMKKYLGPYVPGVSRLLDATVFSQVKEAVGGHINFAVNGGAALSRETQEFFNLAIMTLTQGYGLTESAGMVAFLPPELLSFGPVGLPAPSVEIKFLDCPELGYYSSTSPPKPDGSTSSTNGASMSNAVHLPQGEVLIRGPSVTKGYFNRPDLNEDETIFTKDGWFRTGDIGQWNEDGTLSLIDRLKNLVKMQGGEYIALERLESIYKSCNYISNLCVHASSDMSQPIAIISPHEANIRHALEKPSARDTSGADAPTDNVKSSLTSSPGESFKEMDLARLCREPRVRKMVLNECNALAKKNGFARMEMLADVVLTPEEWSPKNGLLTAAQKVNRAKIAEVFRDEIKESIRKQGGL
ncbi:long-chain-fatty-acid-CoA-ligase [Flammula alnicola]|nr:long-chain-fatty-acid-CoA-ligase [Flammula alnicola]